MTQKNFSVGAASLFLIITLLLPVPLPVHAYESVENVGAQNVPVISPAVAAERKHEVGIPYEDDDNPIRPLSHQDVTIFTQVPPPRLTSFATQNPPANLNATQVIDPTSDDPRIHVLHTTYNMSPDSFGGATINFGSSPANLSGISTFRFGMRTDNNTNNSCANNTNCVKVEFKDITNQTAVVFMSGLNSTYQEKTITAASLSQSNPAINMNAIKEIHFVLDYNMVQGKPNGFLDVWVGGVYYEPPVAPSGNVIPVTDLTAQMPGVSEIEPAFRNTISNFQTNSRSEYQFDYNLANGSDNDFSRWGGSFINFSTPLNMNTQDLVIGVQGTGTNRMKLELISNNGNGEAKVIIQLQNIPQDSYGYYRITKAMLDQANVSNFQSNQIKFAVLVVDDFLAGSKTAAGTVKVQMGGLTFNAVVPTTNQPLTNLSPYLPTVSEIEPEGSNNPVQIVQDSRNHFVFNYNLNHSPAGDGKWGAAMMSFDVNNTLNVGQGLVLGLRGSSTTIVPGDVNGDLITNLSDFGILKANFGATGATKAQGDLNGDGVVNLSDFGILKAGFGKTADATDVTQAKVEFIDNAGRKVVVKITDLTGDSKNYFFTPDILRASSPAGDAFDVTHINYIVIVVDSDTAGITALTGAIEVSTQGLLYRPIIPTTAAALTNFSTIRPTVGELQPCSLIQDPCTVDPVDTSAIDVDSSAHFKLSYDLSKTAGTPALPFAGAIINISGENGYNATAGIVIGMRSTDLTGKKVKVVIEDLNNRKSVLETAPLTAADQNFSITSGMIVEGANGVPINTGQIARIVLVIEPQVTGSTTSVGTLDVNVHGLEFIPVGD